MIKRKVSKTKVKKERNPKKVKMAIENYAMHDSGNYRYKDSVYRQLGYKI